MRRRTRLLSTQILAGQLVVLIVALGAGFGLYARAVRDRLNQQYQQRALAVAQAVASEPAIRDALVRGDRSGTVQTLAEDTRRATQALYVVVIDRQGLRYSHPNPSQIGQVITEPVIALDGKPHVGIDPGSLGRSANGKAPVVAAAGGMTGPVVGEVSAGIAVRQVSSALFNERVVLLLYGVVALALGSIAALLLARRLKKTTFGLELNEIATLLQEREATLHGIREGVVALDRQDHIKLVNDQAHRLLRLRQEAVGRSVDEIFPEGRLRDLLTGAAGGADQVVLLEDRCLVLNRMEVAHQGTSLGAVITLRDRTELEEALRQLDEVRTLTDALRAQQHEFSNRMHALTGLLELGHQEEALTYLTDINAASVGLAASLQARISSPIVVALLVAKTTVAFERGVTLTVNETSELEVPDQQARDWVSILGNLIDNAIDAATEAGPGGTVTVRFLRDDDHNLIEVADTGPGVSGEVMRSIFVDGYSTKAPVSDARRGLGLALVRQLTDKLGGTVSVRSDRGAVFTVVLPRSQMAIAGDER
jgi:two-component system CitB family sensor kinase